MIIGDERARSASEGVAMGLEMVEIVMATEERFGIKLDDADFSRVRTVADFAVCVTRYLPTSVAVSPKIAAFRRLRDLMIAEGGLDRKAIRPSARLDQLFRRHRRGRWKNLQARERLLPPLELTHTADRLIIVPAAVAIMGVMGFTAALIGARGWPKSLVIGTAGAIAFGMFVLMLYRACRTRFPKEMQTVREACEHLSLSLGPSDSDGVRLLWQIRVLDEVRRITAEILGLPLDKVKPESRFVEDLGAG
ncbi:MAG: hypothetical protein U0638_16035 [Phycisphaerales bacterium]